ncbi:MFS transporter, partial [Actinosynnema sp.]|uniref:MFS transporter n=1 Tax=Actinosynnema sp. TaxID=1872144 RepID=UPI003F82C7AE
MTSTLLRAAAARQRRRAAFPGWRMVRVLAVTETISYAALYYCFAVMVAPMRAELGASTAAISGALSLGIAVSGAAAPLVGRHVDRHGARAVMTGGSLLAGAGVLAWSQAHTMPQLYAAFVVIGVASALVLYEPAFAVINTWFYRRRRAALLTMTVVAGFSSTIFLPVSQALVDTLGWRSALVVLAVLVGGCAIPHALVLRRAPSDHGLRPDGTEPAAHDSELTAAAAEGRTAPAMQAAVRRLTLAHLMHTVAVTVVAVHLVGYLVHTGMPALSAATAAGSLGIMSVTGRVVFTGAAQRLGLAATAALIVAGQALGVLVLLTVPGVAGVVLFVLLFGAGFGVMTIARAALLGEFVPRRAFAHTSGRQVLVATVGRVAAPVTAGSIISFGGYVPMFAAVA